MEMKGTEKGKFERMLPVKENTLKIFFWGTLTWKEFL